MTATSDASSGGYRSAKPAPRQLARESLIDQWRDQSGEGKVDLGVFIFATTAN